MDYVNDVCDEFFNNWHAESAHSTTIEDNFEQLMSDSIDRLIEELCGDASLCADDVSTIADSDEDVPSKRVVDNFGSINSDGNDRQTQSASQTTDVAVGNDGHESSRSTVAGFDERRHCARHREQTSQLKTSEDFQQGMEKTRAAASLDIANCLPNTGVNETGDVNVNSDRTPEYVRCASTDAVDTAKHDVTDDAVPSRHQRLIPPSNGCITIAFKRKHKIRKKRRNEFVDDHQRAGIVKKKQPMAATSASLCSLRKLISISRMKAGSKEITNPFRVDISDRSSQNATCWLQ